MTGTQSPLTAPERYLALSAELDRAETVEGAVDRTVEFVEAAFDHAVASVCTDDPSTETVTALGSAVPSSAADDRVPDQIPDSIVRQVGDREGDRTVENMPEATVGDDPSDPVQIEALAPVGRDRVLRVGTERERFDDEEIPIIEAIAAKLETTLSRIGNRQSSTTDCDIARALFDQSDRATFVSDTDGALVAVNRAAVELTGSDRKTLLRSGLADITGDTAAAIREHLDDAITGASEPSTASLERVQQPDLTVTLTSQPFDVDGASYVRTVAHDTSPGAESDLGGHGEPIEADISALRRLSELAVDFEKFDEAIERLLSLGCEYFDLDTGILSHVDGDDYEIDTVVDATGTHEAGAVYDLGGTMCDATLAGDVTEPLAFADIEESDHENHPASESAVAYIGAPVIVDGRAYGTVNFSMRRARAEAFRPEETEFVQLVAKWIGTEIRRRRRFEELERYETILEAVDDPVYALDTEGRFTYVNEAAKREFGYGTEIIGKRPSIGMNESDVKQIRGQIKELRTTDRRSTTAEFELETADSHRKIVENRLGLVGDDEFRGTAGVLRDITARKNRQQQLESFQQAIDEAVDGVAILDGDEYVYVDQTHVDMYGFDDKEQLLGNTWRKLYDDDEVERLEAEALSTLESGGSWVGTATGSRLDGTTFPTELSLTVIDDGRIVCTVRDVTDRRERERELRSFQRAVESARDGVAILDGDEYVYVDQTHVDMYGFDDKEQLLGNTWRKLYDDDEVERLEAEAFPALEANGYWRGNVTGSRPDGTTFPAELSLTVIDDGRLVCTVRDETDRQKRERELRSFQRAVESARDGVAILDGDEYVYVDQTHVDMYGFDDKEQLLGNTWRKLYDDDEVERLEAEAFPALESDGYWRGMVTGSRPDGSTFPAELSLTIVDDGRLVCTVRDETERRKRERELELKERAMDEANVGIQITDPTQEDNPLIYVNDGFERMTGYTRADALGRNPRFLQGEEGDSEEVAQLREAIRTEEPISLELQNERNDGELFWSRLSVTPVTDESGAVKNYIGIQQDVTDRKKRERRTEARNEFLKRIYEVTTDPDLTFERKITDLLEAGREHLDLPYGFLTQIERDDEQGTGSRTIVEALGSHELLQPGESAPLEQSYCRETMEQGGIMALTRAAEAGLSEDSAFETFGLETYIASEVVAGDDPYGTLCFASDTARDRPFDEFERSVIQLAGRWAGYEIDRQNTREALQEERERLGLTLSGTNTGLAEWDVETDEVTWNETLTEILGRDIKSVEEFGAAIHPDDRAQVQQQLDAMVETGETWTGEFRMFDDSDDTLWMGTRATAVYDDEGEPVRVLATGTDVTDRKRRQQKLFEERERFRLLTESVDEYAFIGVDEDGVIQTWNESAEGTFGYDAESATGLSIAELHPEANRERGLPDRLLQQAKVAGESAHEGWRVREDGSKFYADVRYAPLTTTDGEFDGYATIVRDMTNRRRERRRTERFVEESDDVVTIVDPDGTVTYASGSASRVLGYEPDDLVGENLFDHVHPDGRERAMNAFFSCVKESEKVETECRFDSPDEGWINIDGRCRNMLDDDAVNGVLVYLRDVTETRERNRRFEGIFNSTFGLTGLLKPDGTVVEVNDAALEFGGVQRDEVVGESFSDAPWWTQSEVVRSDVREAVDQVADGDFVRYEAEVRGADGLATIDFSVKPVTDEDDNVSLLVFEGRDITALQRHKRHLEVMQRVMRHNMRNDITKLRGWTEMMREEPDAEKRAEQFDTVDQIFDKWVAMTEKTKQIRTVLDSQRGQDVHLEPETLVEEAVAPVREEYTDCSVVTHVPDADVQVPATLLDAVRELVENAAKVTQDPAIEVEVGRSADGWTEVSVRDDGPGMPDMEADVLENGKETPLNHGQGLGLWMVRMIVTQAGGDAVVTSTNGGTDICLRLPGEQTIKNRLSGKAA